jgi:hypothetical protein
MASDAPSLAGSSRGLYWLLPAAFIVHDAEELFMMPAWAAAHREALRTALSRAGLGEYAPAVPAGFTHTAVAIGILLLPFLAVTAGAWRRPRSFAWRALYGGLLGTFFLHAFVHVGQAIVLRAYTPGLVTAVLVVIPASSYLGLALLRRGAIDPWPSMLAALAGIVVFIPAVLGALELSRRLLS